jgi:hypothetical protein
MSAPAAVQRAVRERANGRCEYCHSPEWITGKTPTGRATVARLDFNDERHDDGLIRVSRALWVQGGWHPPVSDPVLPDARHL